MKIFELFNTKAKWEITKTTDSTITWETTINGTRIRFEILYESDDSSEKLEYYGIKFPKNTFSYILLEFCVIDQSGDCVHELTGMAKNKAITIMSSIITKAIDEIERYKPDIITFSGNTTEPSRISLYKSIMKRAKNIGYEELKLNDKRFFPSGSHEYELFTMIRKDIVGK